MSYITFQPSDHFNTKLYTGNDGANSITGVGFQPDWVWLKPRNYADHHRLIDAVRGQYTIYTNRNVAQDANSSHFTSFDSDGFTLAGSDGGWNSSSYNYVSWNWKANGSGSANTDGSVTSTVSANTTAGISIVKWTANLSSAVTVGHGLGTTPKVLIQKAIDQTSGWIVSGFGLDWSGYLPLESTGAFNNDSNDTSGTGRFFSAGGTEPNSTIFSTNSSALTGSATDVIAYCFAEKKGFSKFGSFTGNGNADGTFIYTGFSPAFVLYKVSSTSSDWYLQDNKRLTYNVNNTRLEANNSDAEVTGAADSIDMLSNGFKLRHTSASFNASGGSYIYMAFAEHPLVSSNGIPATAR